MRPRNGTGLRTLHEQQLLRRRRHVHIQAAVNKQFGMIAEPSAGQANDPVPQEHPEEEGDYEDPGMYQDFEEEPDLKYGKYKKFVASGKNFEKKYPVRRSEGFLKSLSMSADIQFRNSSKERKKKSSKNSLTRPSAVLQSSSL